MRETPSVIGLADKNGAVRLGWGLSGATISYWAHLEGESNWRRLTKFEIFSRGNHFEPIAISAEDPDAAYAFGPSEGRSAIWLIDLKDKDDPRLVFSHPLVDVSSPTRGRDGRLIGVRYDNGNPMVYYVDGRIKTMMDAVQKVEPGTFNTLHGSTLDEKTFVISLHSDVEATRFAVFDGAYQSSDRSGRCLTPITATPRLWRPCGPLPTYPARDGTRIPAYLSTPRRRAPPITCR